MAKLMYIAQLQSGALIHAPDLGIVAATMVE
jgi:hypothetical protein